MSTPAYHAARWRAARSAPSDDRLALVTGADRASWLQGLATNDVLALGPGEGCYAAFLTPQGRMLTDTRILHLGDAFLLALPSATADAALARLDQCIVMEDVALAEIPGPVARLAIHGPEAAVRLASALGAPAVAGALEALPEHHAVLVRDGAAGVIAPAAGLPDSPHAALVISTRGFGLPGFEVMTTRDGLAAIDEALARDGVPVLDADDATALRIEAGRPLFGPDLTTDTIPLEAGIEDRAISFTKGCYVGQEVIVRVRDRGHGRVARRLVALVARDGDPAAPLEPGDLLRRDGRDTGHVTSAAWSPALTAWVGLGYVGREDAGPGTVVTAVRDGTPRELEVRTAPLVAGQRPPESPLVVTAAVVEQDGALLLTRRLEGTHLAGAWEFPGGKCEPGETLEESLRRELLEELGVNVDIGEEVFTATHAYPSRTVELHFFACRLRGEPHPRQGQEMRWAARWELPGMTFPEADAELVAALAAGRLVLSATWPGPGSPQTP